MPIYEYECEACGKRFEAIQKFSDALVATCMKCGKGPVRRLMSSPAIQFKGSGWYITDYAQKGKSDSASTPAGKTEKTDAAEKTQTKTETKTETTSTAASTSSKPSSNKPSSKDKT
jgi:putative FmdB family regulatory protein